MALIVAGGMLLVLALGLVLWLGLWAPLGAAFFAVSPGFLSNVQAGVQRNLAPELWNDVLQPVLTWPSWVIPFVLGDLLLTLGILRLRRGI